MSQGRVDSRVEMETDRVDPFPSKQSKSRIGNLLVLDFILFLFVVVSDILSRCLNVKSKPSNDQDQLMYSCATLDNSFLGIFLFKQRAI